MTKGKFIVFEGPDGAGKTTQIHRVAELLRRQGKSVITTREPGGSKIGGDIRKILLSPSTGDITALSELFLVLADRTQHIEDVIVPNVQKGTYVLCDRFVESSVVYQGVLGGLGETLVRNLNSVAVGALEPSLTVFFSLSKEMQEDRMAGRGEPLDRIEGSTKRLSAVRNYYNALVQRLETDPVYNQGVVNANLPVDTVTLCIMDLIGELEKENGKVLA